MKSRPAQDLFQNTSLYALEGAASAFMALNLRKALYPSQASISAAITARDNLGNIATGFTGTLVAMMALNPPFGALVRRLPRLRFIGITYRFFMLNLLVFLLLFRISTGGVNIWVGRAFFIWASV